jgi:hypothetical protein
VSDIAFYIALVWAIGATSLWLREDQRRRDFQTDMLQLVHDYDVTFDELRRTQKYKSVKRRVADVKHIHFTEEDERRQQ